MPSRQRAEKLDQGDPLAPFRDEFIIPDPDLVYLDGNSLGRAPKAARTRVLQVLENEWAGGLIRSWEHWLDLPRKIGDQIGPIIGSLPGEVIVHDSTSINLYQAIHIALDLQPQRRVIVIDAHEFPTDRFISEEIARRLNLELRYLTDDLSFDDVAVIVRSVVDYRTAEMCDVQAFSAKARSAGACVVWDLSHTAGAIEFDVHKLGVDIAVGCTYKFLNGGPGAPAWAYVSQELHERLSPPIRGWFAHRNQFAMEGAFVPHDDARRLLIGTPHILSLVAAEEGIALVARAGMPTIASKGRALVEFGFEVADFFDLPTMTPRDPLKRGCHLAIRNDRAADIVQTLALHHGVIADSRPPDVIRLGMSPLTTRFTDVWDGIERIAHLVGSDAITDQGHHG